MSQSMFPSGRLSLGMRERVAGGIRRRKFHVALVVGAWCCTLAGVACRDDRVPTEPRISSAWLTGQAVEAVASDGHFRLHVVQRHPLDEVSSEEATRIAATWVHTNGLWLRHAFEQDRGSPVDPRHVSECGRVFYAETPYAELPQSASHTLRTVYGPWWLVTLCDDRWPAISVAVSAYSKNLKVTNGVVSGIGNELFATGIPATLPSVPMSPEEAVQMAVAQTGARVSEVPVLMMAPRPESPQTAKWMVTLDRPVMIRGLHSKLARPVTTVFVGFTDTWHEKAIQADDPSVPASAAGSDAAAAKGGAPPPVSLAPRAGFSLALERVEVVKP
jgi:hypothetical protein